MRVPATGSCSLFVGEEEEAAAALAANSFNPLLVFLNPRASRPSPPVAAGVVVVDGPGRDPDADGDKERDESEPEAEAAANPTMADPLYERAVLCFRLLLLLLLLLVVAAELDRRLLLSLATPPPSSRVAVAVLLLVFEEPSPCDGDCGRGPIGGTGAVVAATPPGTRKSDDDDAAGDDPFRWLFGFEERKRFLFALDAIDAEVHAVPCPACGTVSSAASAAAADAVPVDGAAGAFRGSSPVDEAAVATEEDEDEKDGRRLSCSRLS